MKTSSLRICLLCHLLTPPSQSLSWWRHLQCASVYYDIYYPPLTKSLLMKTSSLCLCLLRHLSPPPHPLKVFPDGDIFIAPLFITPFIKPPFTKSFLMKTSSLRLCLLRHLSPPLLLKVFSDEDIFIAHLFITPFIKPRFSKSFLMKTSSLRLCLLRHLLTPPSQSLSWWRHLHCASVYYAIYPPPPIKVFPDEDIFIAPLFITPFIKPPFTKFFLMKTSSLRLCLLRHLFPPPPS